MGWWFLRVPGSGTSLRIWGPLGPLMYRKMHTDKSGPNTEDRFMDPPMPWTCPLTPQLKGRQVKPLCPNLSLALTCNSSRGIFGQPVVTHSHLYTWKPTEVVGTQDSTSEGSSKLDALRRVEQWQLWGGKGLQRPLMAHLPWRTGETTGKQRHHLRVSPPTEGTGQSQIPR